MIIQVLSDLHLDLNKDYPYEFETHEDISPDVVVFAGDISGYPSQVSKFLNDSFKNLKYSTEYYGDKTNVLFVCGNHIVYNDDGKTIEEIKEKLHNEFPYDSRITFMDESVGVVSKEINGVLFVGSCTYTDYKFKTFGKNMRKVVESNMRNAAWTRPSQEAFMNDFRFGTSKEPILPRYKYGKVIPEKFSLMPHHYRRYFHRTMKEFEKVISKNGDKPVVLITHHCLSPKCMTDRLDKKSLTASYLSQMEDFIKRHKNIKLVISGHIHNEMDFDLIRDDGSVCKYVMNPRGYTKEHQSDEWSPYFYVDTENWNVIKKSYNREDWKKTLKESDDRFLEMFRKYGGCFI